ncbi:polysaccharide pyruvyl transferase family protein [Alteromonas sp. P256]|uniref:polysaccharide pyruvyl transferase family protein n=1 Tax=Alteromonas sp. P256 TaxID=3117399 RepID=UPI002FE39E0C
MAIYYHSDFSKKHGQRNFGDDINPYILQRFLPKSVIASEDTCVIGIGTLLNNGLLVEIKPYKKAIIFCSGVGYGNHGQLIGHEKLTFAGVRGPKSCEALKLPGDIAKTDAAILLADKKIDTKKKYKTTFIPHINTDWSSGKIIKRACDDLDIRYIAPNADLEEFLDTINKSESVITEAMHGAIVADTLRVPWIPVKIHNALGFKWEDWTSSMGIDYSPNVLTPIYDPTTSLISNVKSHIKFSLFKTKLKTLVDDVTYLSAEQVFEQKLGDVLKLTESDHFKVK